MKRNLLIIVNEVDSQNQVQQLHSKEALTFVQDVETAIEQLYRTSFDAVLYEAGLDETQEKKLLKIISLAENPPMILRKESWTDWASSLEEVINSLKSKINIIDDGFKNAGFNICLN